MKEMITNEKKKELVRQDICSRLAHGIYVCFNPLFPLRVKSYQKDTDCLMAIDDKNNTDYSFKIYKYKPYLRAIESMTSEERESTLRMTDTEYFDWLCRENFDYRGLIPLGLAIKITKENNPYEKINH